MRPRLLSLLSCFLLVASLASAQRGDRRDEVQKPLPDTVKVPPSPVLTPEEEAATFKLAPGFRAELVAADPLVGDPIALQFGPDGRLWVLEMRGYMPNADGVGEDEPVGVVAVLTDTDGDGRYDRRAVFADKLVMPRALALVADGVLIAEPPHLWFFRDTDGDGKADEKTAVATDYGNTNNPEHNANGLMWALDNWIYSANYTARFRWAGGGNFLRDETITRGQWGISQDDTGRIYYNSNSDPLRFDAVPAVYLKRNPSFAAAGANVQLVPANLRIWPGRMTPGVNRGYRTLDDEFKITAMTAACGPVVYRGALFPAEFYGDAFVAEPSGNLIKRIKLHRSDGVVSGANAYEGTEFMTSTDERFRPVNLYNGPDGALYVVDFYRGILQHRIYLTSFLRKQIEERGLDKGLAKGRIWRIVPDGAPKADFRLGLARASGRELVAQLSSPNGWVRDTAQRLLVERGDAAAHAELAKLAVSADQPALARLHALWALDGADVLGRATIVTALDDRDARVAAAAVRLSEKFIARGADAELAARVAAMVHKRSEPEVRLQLAFTLGEVRTPAGDEALQALASTAGQQPWLADAIVSGLGGREADFVAALVRKPHAAEAAHDVMRFATSAVLKSGDAARIAQVLVLAGSPQTSEPARAALLAGVRHFLPRSPDGRTLIGNLPAEPKPLLALEQTKSPAAEIAKELLTHLKWPGKAGATVAAARPLSAAEKEAFARGKDTYAQFCAACHQPNGQGLAGLAPSLVNSQWVLGDPRILARIVLHGKTQENLIMPPWRAALDDEAVGAVLTFLRRSWGHEADPVAAAIIARTRRDTATREEPFTEPELRALMKSLRPPRK